MFHQTQATERAEECRFLFLVTLSDVQTHQSKGPNTQANLFSVPEIFHTQTKKPQTDSTKNKTFRSSLRVAKT